MRYMQKISSFLRPVALTLAHQPIVPNFLTVVIVFWKCAWIIILMVPYIYVTF